MWCLFTAIAFAAYHCAAVTFGGVVTTLTPLAEQRNVNASTVPLAQLTFNRPRGIAVNSAGEIFVTDASYVLRINTGTSTATLLAGQVGVFGYTDGDATTVALLNSPAGVAIVGSALYFADSANNAIRSVLNGRVTTVAGASPTSTPGFADGTGSNARFNLPDCVVGDDANAVLYVCDLGNLRIRRVTTAGVVTTLGTILSGNSQPSVRMVLRSSTLYIARQLQNTPQSNITTSSIAGGAQTGFTAVPQSPAAAVVDPTGQYFVVVQDNRIGVITVSTGGYQDITGLPTTQAAADGQYPNTTPVFIQLVDIARTSSGNFYYSLEAGPTPRLRSITVLNIDPIGVTFTILSTPPITNTTALATLTTLVQQQIQAFVQARGYSATTAAMGTSDGGNVFTATVPTWLAPSVTSFAATLNNAGNPVADFVTAFNANATLAVLFPNPQPPRSLLPAQGAVLVSSFEQDLRNLIADPRVSQGMAALGANNVLVMTGAIPGPFINASTQSRLVPANFPSMADQLSSVSAVRIFDARIFAITAAQLTTASRNFATDVGNIANTDNIVTSTPVVTASEVTLSASAPKYVLQPFVQIIAARSLENFPTLFAFLNTIQQSQMVRVSAPFYPTSATEQADILSNITARARMFAGSTSVTAEVTNTSDGQVTIIYRYPSPLNTLNFSNVNLTGVFPTGQVIIPATLSPMMMSSCPPVCIAVVVVVGSILLILLLLLLLWCCCKRERKSDDVIVGQPQFQPVFQPQEGGSTIQRRTSVDLNSNPLYRTSELRDSRRLEQETSVPAEPPAASVGTRLLYHQLRDPELEVPVMESAPAVRVTSVPSQPAEKFEEVIRVLHVSPRREGSRSTRIPNPLVYDSVMRRLETQDAAPGSDSIIRVVKVVTRDSPSRSNRSTSTASRSKRHVRVDTSPNPHVPELADTAAPHTLTAVESALRQL